MMESFLLYIGKAAVASAVCCLVFLLLFRNRRQFVFNRWYLPVSMVASYLIPLVTITTVSTAAGGGMSDVAAVAYLPESVSLRSQDFTTEWYHYIFLFYLAGWIGLLINFMLGHLKALRIIKECRQSEMDGCRVSITQRDVHPFSFFSNIVIPERMVRHPHIGMILGHEKIHVKEKHTLDIMFTEIMFIFQWFNPFAWLIRDAVKTNLEYKTDHEILKRFDERIYQLTMVTLADKRDVAPFLTAMNGSQLKNRIIMMKKKQESKKPVVRQMSVVPLLAVLIFALSNREVIYSDYSPVQGSVSQTLMEMENQKGTVIKGRVADENGKALPGAAVLIRGSAEGTISDYEGKYEIRVKRGDELVFSMPGKESVTMATDKTELNVQLRQADQSDRGTGTESIRIVKGERLEPKGENAVDEGKSTITIRSASGNASAPLYIIDGEKAANIDGILPENIESIDVLKGNTATARYGEEAKNGAVIIRSKAGKTEQKKAIKGNPLIYLDGKEYNGKVDDIPPGEISSVSVIKDSSLTKLYGEKARDGVIMINTNTKYNSNTDKKVVEGRELPGKITTTEGFRKLFAQNIKYPAQAQQNDIQGLVELWAVVDGDGKITRFLEKPPMGNVADVDEVVVVAYGSKKSSKTDQETSGKEVVVIGYASDGTGKVPSDGISLLREEVKRVILLSGPLDIPELKGKTASLRVKFVLQK